MADESESERTRTITREDPRPAARKAREMSGSEFFDQMRRGKISAPPSVHLPGMEAFSSSGFSVPSSDYGSSVPRGASTTMQVVVQWA